MSSDEQPNAATGRSRRLSSAGLLMLGVFSIIGLVGFVATFVLIVFRSPGAQVPRALTAAELQGFVGQPGPPGARGPAGPPGPQGLGGPSGIRILRSDCDTGNCTATCDNDEVLLNAYCGPNRTSAVYPTDHSALCRSSGRGKVEVVAACVKDTRR